MKRTGREVRLPVRCAVCFSSRPLSHLCPEVPQSLGCLVLLLAGGVGIGSEHEADVVVRYGGVRLDGYAGLEGQGGKCMAQVVKSEMV